MGNCPSCNSKEIRIFDKGIKKLWRFLNNSNRVYCKNCKSTWRINHKNHIAKIRPIKKKKQNKK